MGTHRNDGAAAPALAATASTRNDKAHVASAGQVEEHQSEQHDFASKPNNCKALATLQAEFALRGFVLASLHDGSLIVERWGFIKALDNITQATQFLQAIGGRI